MSDERDDLPEGETRPPQELQAISPDIARQMAPRWLVDFREQRKRGFYRTLGDHALVFADRGDDHLLVSFDNLSSARDDAMNRDPWGYSFAAKNGWSQLGFMAFKPSWFRDPALFQEMRTLADSGFFRRFRSVTLTGTSMGGYGACAFASLVPGCTVVAFSPQSTLDPALVPWEERFASGRKADWSGDFADAATQSAAAARVWLIYDPHFGPDVQHVARFTHDRAIRLPARYSGHKSALFLRRAEILSTIMREAMAGTLSESSFFGLYRRGRALPWYVHGVADRIIADGNADRLNRLMAALRNTGYGPMVLRGIRERAAEAGLLNRPQPPRKLAYRENPRSLDAGPQLSAPNQSPVDAPQSPWQQMRDGASKPRAGMPWQSSLRTAT
ncbi:hypothetical protein [Paracoccus laeviglucosivorans]|uniref:Uncharacterized protein n=1 Tax=Paracoccus laeviglucosivorans TaxID=1197861 RepID=A0A521E6N9_9RHOB|nr:hypothetical protein [Paracoccus laeviglucosivorans]SMO79567.1 hypothetical protein SAMN06265221_111113 [Paracoccus laeviglucosivorans]